MIDLRSDTKTLPTEEMLVAMHQAELGDCKANEDPTVLQLETMAARAMGMEAAMLVISGTMANLCALLAHADPGDAYFTDPDAHVYFYEKGHVAVAGLLPLLVESQDGFIDPDTFAAAISASPQPAQLLCLENPHNRGGGRVIPIDLHAKLCQIAHQNGMRVHVDGARIFDTVVASGTAAAEYARHIDSIMFCLSKSLSCPLGSVLCGNHVFIAKAKLAQARLGGGMRQAGIIAAPGIVALETMIERLSEDHAHARRLAMAAGEVQGLSVNMATVQTNMVSVDVHGSGKSAEEWIQDLARRGVLIGSYGPARLRLVTHRHHDDHIIEEAIQCLHATGEAFAG